MKTYRVALIGAGVVAQAHLDALRAAGERVELAAVCGVDATQTKAFAERNQIPHSFTDVDKLLSTVQPDLVHILTPPHIHLDLCVRCLEAGSWVFCEKPLCASLAEFDALTAAEARTGRYVNTVFQWRFGSAAQHLKRLIDTGALGRFLVGVCQTLWYRDEAYYQVPWRGKWATEVGGTTMGHGIHLMDLLLWLIPNWQEVHALATTLNRDIEVDNVSLAMVQFASGALASIANSAVSPRQQSYLRLDFEQTTAEVSALYSYTNADWRFTTQDEATAAIWPPTTDVPATQTAQLLALLDSMDRNERPAVSGDEARRPLEFAASLYKSAFTHQPVLRGSITPDDPFYHAMNGKPEAVHRG